MRKKLRKYVCNYFTINFDSYLSIPATNGKFLMVNLHMKQINGIKLLYILIMVIQI